jgi:hypothetical protein
MYKSHAMRFKDSHNTRQKFRTMWYANSTQSGIQVPTMRYALRTMHHAQWSLQLPHNALCKFRTKDVQLPHNTLYKCGTIHHKCSIISYSVPHNSLYQYQKMRFISSTEYAKRVSLLLHKKLYKSHNTQQSSHIVHSVLHRSQEIRYKSSHNALYEFFTMTRTSLTKYSI